MVHKTFFNKINEYFVIFPLIFICVFYVTSDLFSIIEGTGKRIHERGLCRGDRTASPSHHSLPY